MVDGDTSIADTVIASVAAAISLIALIFAGLSWRTARSAQKLAERQDGRRQPKLEIRLLEAHGPGAAETVRAFDFRLQIGNLADAPNTISRLELCVRFTRGLPLTVRVDGVSREDDRRPGLLTPLRLDVHDTAEGWCHFEIPENLLTDARVTSYVVIATDTHQNETTMETFVLLGGVR